MSAWGDVSSLPPVCVHDDCDGTECACPCHDDDQDAEPSLF